MTAQPFDVLFPLESVVRELDYRLILASRLVARGARVLLGRSDVVKSAALLYGGGVYLGKDIFHLTASEQIADYHRLKRRGFRVLHLDEEGAVYSGDEQAWRSVLFSRLDPMLLRDDDVICAWGAFQKDAFDACGPRASVIVTGHPRFDLAGPRYRALYEAEADELRRRYGSFALVTTSWPDAHNAGGEDVYFSLARACARAGYQREEDIEGQWRYARGMVDGVLSLVRELAKARLFDSVIVRPHPSEDFSTYERAVGSLAGVHVLHEGGPLPWLLASRVLVHGGSTTALEASFARVPAVSYQPFGASAYEKPLPSAVSARVEDRGELLRLLEGLARGAPVSAGDTALRARLIANGSLPSDAFSMLEDLVVSASSTADGRAPRGRRLAQLARWHRRADDVEAVLFALRGRAGRARYRDRKFPRLEESALAERFQRIEGIGVKTPRWRLLGPHLMALS